MPFDGVSYGASAWGTSTVAGSDGLTYTVLLDHATGAEVTTTLRLTDVRTRWSVEQSGEGAASCLSPLMVSTTTLTVADYHRGMFSALSEGSDGEWRLRVKQGANLNWLGYAVPNGVYELPYGTPPLVTLTFSDGIGLLEGHPMVLGADDEPIITRLAQILWPLGACEEGGPGDGNDLLADSWSGLTTVMDWRPYRTGVQIDSDEDPAAHIIIPNRAFTDADGVPVSQAEALRIICNRFGARLFQSQGRWWFVQREVLAQDADAVRTFAYDRALAVTESEATFIKDMRITQAGRKIEGVSPARGMPVPVRKVTSTYDFEPDGYKLVLNGSFEEAGYPSGQTAGAPSTSARFWDFSFHASHNPSRQDLSQAPEYGMDPADGEVWALRMPGNHSSEAQRTATQYGFTYVRAEDSARFELSYSATLEDDVAGRWGSGWGEVARVRLGLSDGQGTLLYGVHRHQLNITSRSRPGDDVTIYVEPVLAGVTGIEAGVQVLPTGAVVQVYSDTGTPEGPMGTITLTAPLHIGDHEVRGDLFLDQALTDYNVVRDEHCLFIYYWKAGNPSTNGETDKNIWIEDTSGDFEDLFFTGSSTVGGYDITGTLVEGFPWIRLMGPETSDPGESGNIRQYFDRLRWEYVSDGEVGQIVEEAEMYEGAPGVEVPLPIGSSAHPTGDGPAYDTETGLISVDALGTNEERTQQGNGVVTNWTRGMHTGAPAERVTIDDLLADGALRMIGGAVEKWEATLHLRSSTTLYPHEVELVHQASGLAPPPTSGTHDTANDSGQSWIRMYHRPEVGRNVIIAPGTASVETKVVADYYPWFNSWVVELTTNLASSHATGTTVIYEQLFWPDVFEQDVVAGSYAVSGTRLQWIPYEIPGPPEELTGVPDAGEIEWTWTAVDGATHYRIEWGIVSGGPYTAHAVVEAPTVTYTATGLTDGLTYYAVARAGLEYGGTGASAGGFLLLENNDNILLESGDDLLMN